MLPPLIAGLLRPQAYPHPADRVELVETHISWVLLAGDFAYKIKKPVRLDFLDFSTLERRLHYCREELRLNRRLAPEWYLDVVAVGGTVDHPRVGASPALEYAVQMRRFPAGAELDALLARGGLGPAQLDAVAALVAGLHRVAAVAAPGTPWGGPDAILGHARDNLAALATGGAAGPGLESLRDWTERSFAAHREHFAARRAGGFVRECHGDLHLHNLAWVEGRPLAFDCLEFDPALRWIDVLDEAAFLVMDLRARGEPALAVHFLNRYLEHTGDYAGLPVLPFYLVYRSLVRAKVEWLRAGQADAASPAAVAARSAGHRYLQLAAECAMPPRPMLVVTRGPSASGKSTLTGLLAGLLGAVRLRSDVERKRLHGLEARTAAGAAVGEGLYAADASRLTYARLRDLAGLVLAAGFPVIVDAACLEAGQRAPFRGLAAERRVPFAILEVTAAPDTLRRRLSHRPREVSDADLAVLEHQLAHWQPLAPAELPHALKVDTEAAPDLPGLAARLRGVPVPVLSR